MSCSARRMWASTGLRWASPETRILKSRAAAPVASTSSGKRITGAFGGLPESTSQVASPMAAKSVSMPFSSRFVRATLWMAARRRRASLKAVASSESSGASGKRLLRLTGLAASSRSKAPCVETVRSTRREIESTRFQVAVSNEPVAARGIEEILLPPLDCPTDGFNAGTVWLRHRARIFRCKSEGARIIRHLSWVSINASFARTGRAEFLKIVCVFFLMGAPGTVCLRLPYPAPPPRIGSNGGRICEGGLGFRGDATGLGKGLSSADT